MTTEAPPQPSTGVPTPDRPSAGKRSAWSRFWRAYGLAVLFAARHAGDLGVLHRAFHVPKYLLPSPSQIAVSLKVDWAPYLAPATWVTLREVLSGSRSPRSRALGSRSCSTCSPRSAGPCTRC